MASEFEGPVIEEPRLIGFALWANWPKEDSKLLQKLVNLFDSNASVSFIIASSHGNKDSSMTGAYGAGGGAIRRRKPEWK